MTGADSAVTFQDWVEVSSSVMGDLSESSSIWWKGVVDLVQSTYERWLAASPLERIGIEPQGSEQWTSGRWLRVNARASTMLLASMPEDLRVDIVSRRLTQDCVRMLFRTFTFYQPGGSAERQDVLKRLQSPGEYAGGESLEAALKAVRAWPRWLKRCRAVKMAPPDASVLARGLLNLTDKHINLSADAAFRTSVLRITLRLDSCPTTEQVQAYQRHLQAELEAMMTPKSSTVEPVLQPKARDASVKTSGSEFCKYFAKAGGCRRGEKCSYSHSMAERLPSGTAKSQDYGRSSEEFWIYYVTSEHYGNCGYHKQVVQAQNVEPSGDSSPEKTRPTMKVLRLKDLRVCSMRGTTTALVDSGATHSLRTAKSPEEWMEAEEVSVQLAGSHQLTMRLSRTGTLLMPYKKKVIKTEEDGDVKAQTMGQLIQSLGYSGYSMTWTPEVCYLTAPDGARLSMRTESGCPEISELEALTLIARLEDRKLDLLNNEVLATSDKLNVSALAMERRWNHYLYDHVAKGNFESGLRVVRDAPFFADLPGECLSELIPSAGLWSGWNIMKQVGFLSRPQRRKLWSSKRWVVRVFAGTTGHWEFFKLDQNDTSVIELDVNRCAGHNLMRSEVWRMLLWGAREGKVDVVMGAPPGRSCEYSGKGQRDLKDVKLVARMMWLYVVAQVGRELNGSGSTKDRDVGFVLEYPEGITQEERETRRQRVEAADREYRTLDERGGPASWSQTASYWESVQRPRWEEFAGVHTLDAKASFWDTRLWKSFQREGELRTVSFDQGAMGGATRNRTTLGTNLNNLMSLDGVRVPEGLDSTSKGAMGKNLKYLLVAKYLESLSIVIRLREFFAESKGQEEVPAATVQFVPEGLPEEDQLDYELSEPGGPEDEGREQDGDDHEEPGGQDAVMMGGECHPPEMTFLTFAVALPHNQSSSVKRALQDIVLYLQMHGFPVYRFHGDKGEFFNHQFRSWLRDQGVFGTWSEPSVPQSNGHAESTVRWIKDRTRTFLRAASLQVRLWPVAAAMVAAEQRGKVLGWQPRLAAPFGAPVYIRKKAFDKAGPLRRERGLESKWMVGKYMGLSTIVHNGHLVYVEAQEGEREKFLHTLHVKAALTEPGGPVDNYRVDDPPKPRRRVVEKNRPSGVEMRALAKDPEELYKMIKRRLSDLLNNWCTSAALELIERLAEEGFFEARKFGVYRHGGIVGWLDGVKEFPELTQVMTKLVVELEPEAVFTSAMVSYNAQREMHKDFNNDYQTQNYVIPVVCPDRGGELWVELKSGDVLQGVIAEREVSTKKMYGQLMPLESGRCLKFGPQRHHEVAQWEGVRTVLIAYTPDCLGKLSQEDLEVLHDRLLDIGTGGMLAFSGGYLTFFAKKDSWVGKEAPGHQPASCDQSFCKEGLVGTGLRVSTSTWTQRWPATGLDECCRFLAALTEPCVGEGLRRLREASMLWCNFRDETMRSLPAPRGLRWQQGRAITSWWTMRDSCGKVCAVIVVYVDDYLICGPRDIVMEISGIIQHLRRESETSEEIYVLQQGYIQELLRFHEVKSTQRDKVPITKDLATVPDKEEDHDDEMVRRAQQITGEVVWVAQRTRPDASYATSMMASMCSKFPGQVLQIGLKTLGYLQRTMDYALVIKWEEKGLVMYCDAAYAPQGLPSHGGWEREAEYDHALYGRSRAVGDARWPVAMKGVEAILSDAGEQVTFRQIASDSTSALSISGGTSSWRTRHLRIEAAWLQEQRAHGQLETVHCPEERQPADLLTKALSSARTDDLLRWWKVKEYGAKVVYSLTVPTVSTRLLVAMVCCVLVVSVQAAEEEDRPRARRGQGLQVDWDLAGAMMFLLMLLGGLMVWEAVRWCCLEFYRES
ncbi:unnamed protein product [Symbiodinium sp. CCMP2592]|nr:unnamed protein product [Symbiodinium sp. CCMP2592]